MIKSIEWNNHKILGNLKLNFQKEDGTIYNTIVFAGENGTGKTTVLETMATFLNLGSFEPFNKIEYSINGESYEIIPLTERVQYGYHKRIRKSDNTQKEIRTNRNNNIQIIDDDAEDIRHYLCHKDYSAYVRKRWPDRKIAQSYFVPGGANGLYFFNALSRLWWWAHFTYDESSTDKYALTRILFDNQMFGKDLLDTLNRNNFTRLKGILLAVQEFKDKIAPNEGLSVYSREFKKRVDRIATIKMFDYLDVEEIKDIAFDLLCKVRESIKKEQ